jgi:hypothetical protein
VKERAVVTGGRGAPSRPLAKAEARSERKPSLARAELVDKLTQRRLLVELDGAIKRRPSTERKLAGVFRTLAPLSAGLRSAMADATSTFIRRGTFDRELYGACIRSLAECSDPRTTGLLKAALAHDSAGGVAALSASCLSEERGLGPLLAKIAAGHRAHLSFAAETARVARGEANGRHLHVLAPMIKESHRLTLCAELFVPLARALEAGTVSPEPLRDAGPALSVLRGAERHLGRWLVLAEVQVSAGDRSPLDEAHTRATTGPLSARAAWSLVAWALDQRAAEAEPPPPAARPTVEIVARLSDRPSADRDPTFLFRMARAKSPSARPMLESLAKGRPLHGDSGVRAALYLARDHGRKDLRQALLEAADPSSKEELRGIATAALVDVGDPATIERAKELAADLLGSKSLANVAWGVLVRAASPRGAESVSHRPWAPLAGGVTNEAAVRWLHSGWLE